MNKIPLLFLIYANDVPDSVFFSICFPYADDLKLLHNEPDVNTGRLQGDLKRLESWCFFNKLFFNAKKCFFLNVRYCPINLTIGEVAMRSPNYVKGHGRTISNSVHLLICYYGAPPGQTCFEPSSSTFGRPPSGIPQCCRLGAANQSPEYSLSGDRSTWRVIGDRSEAPARPLSSKPGSSDTVRTRHFA